MTEDQSPPISNEALFAQKHHRIWTTSFLLTFAILIVLGTSIASLLTQGWTNGYFSPETILFSYLGLIFISWLLLTIKAQSTWMRMGAILGCVWSALATVSYSISLHGSIQQAAIITDLATASNCILLASFICLSIGKLPFQKWDSYLFRILPIIIFLTMLINEIATHNLQSTEKAVATMLLLCCLAVWWLRPIHWQLQPAPGCLFGLAICLQFLLALPEIGTGSPYIFLSQIMLLCILLGAVRLLQG